MPVNLDKMNQEKQRRKGAGQVLNLPEGDTACYICSGARPEDDTPYKEVKVHYGLGKQGKQMAICTERGSNPILLDPFLVEQMTALGVKLEPCAVCEGIEGGDASLNDEDNGLQSRWYWIVAPIKHRASGDQPYSPWPTADQIGALIVGYRVWDSILDKFAQVRRDITNPDKATLVRVVRTGKGLATRWTVEVDLETFGEPLVLSDSLRKAVATQTQPGQPMDVYRLIASMIRSRTEVQALVAGTLPPEEDEFEEGDKPAEGGEAAAKPEEKPAGGKHAPPPGAQKGKGRGGKAADAKPDAAKSNGANGAAAAEKAKPEEKKADGPQGNPPPCFKMDCAPADAECQKCPWKAPCAPACGVPTPADPGAEKKSAEPAKAAAGETVAVSELGEADLEKKFLVPEDGGVVAAYKGSAKGKHFFEAPDGKRFRYEGDARVGKVAASSTATSSPQTAPEGDDELDKLEALLQKKKAEKAAAKA